MPFGIAAAAAAVGGAYMQSQSARKASNAQQRAAQSAQDESARQYDQSRADMQPWLQAGQWALGQQQNLLNDPSQIKNNAQYQWQLEQGFKGLDRGAASMGNLWGGGADADRIKLGQGLASQGLDQILNRYAGLSGTGQQSAGQLGQLGSNYADQQQGNLFSGANARASGYANNANIWGNALQQVAQGVGQAYGNNFGRK